MGRIHKGDATLDTARVFGFEAWQSAPRVMAQTHVHTDIEVNLFAHGTAQYFLAGRFHTLLPGRLCAFWAGMPHRLTQVDPGTTYYCMTLPLAWFLAWQLAPNFTAHLMHGGMAMESDAARAASDTAQFAAWVADLDRTHDCGPERTRIALLEVEARLRRLALQQSDIHTPVSLPDNAGQARHLERMAAYIGARFADSLTIEAIAQDADLHPGYAMTVFREQCGLSLWEYVTRLRVSHAQRLLLTTAWTVERIARECGFQSSSRFFAVFAARCGTTPRRYRLQGQ